MVYVTADEFLNLIRTALHASELVDDSERLWHPEDIWNAFDLTSNVVRSVLENSPVERR